jgi:hypothetical protein
MEEVLGKCTFAHSIRYQAYHKGTAVSFLKGGPDTNRQGLVISVWPARACHKYFRGSHLLEAEEKGKRTLWESPSAAVEEAGCKGFEETSDEVGLYGTTPTLVSCSDVLTTSKYYRRCQD